MTAQPFQPVYRDGLSAAALIAELARSKPYGYVMTYGEIAEQLGIEAAEGSRIRAGIARAKPLLLREYHRALEAIPNKGYRIAKPGEHARLSVGQRRKSDRALIRAIKLVKHADEADMTDSERERNRKVAMALTLIAERQVDTERRVSRLEDLLLGKHKPTVIPGSVVQPLAIEQSDD